MSKHLLSGEINYKQRASRAKTEVSSRWRTSWPHPHSSWSTWCPGIGWQRRQWQRPWSRRWCKRCHQGCRPWRRTRPTISVYVCVHVRWLYSTCSVDLPGLDHLTGNFWAERFALIRSIDLRALPQIKDENTTYEPFYKTTTYRNFRDWDGVLDLEPEVAGDLREGPGAVGKVAYEIIKDWGQCR